jgi:hypothetical protein
MSSAADIVKRLQSLQKCLSELQNQNKELKDYNHRLVEEKNGLLEKIAVLEAQSSSSTEPKIVVSASLNAAESGLIQKVLNPIMFSFNSCACGTSYSLIYVMLS